MGAFLVSSPGRVLLGTTSRAVVSGCGARCPGLRRPAAVVALDLVLCRGCCWLRASLACLLTPRLCAAPRSRCSGRLSRRRDSSPHPEGCRPRFSWAAAQGTWRPAENRAHGACRWPPLRRGRWERSASSPFRVPDGVVAGGSFRRRSWAVYAAVVGVSGPGH